MQDLSYAESKLNLFGMLHSTKNATFGLGMNYESIRITGIYNTSSPALSQLALEVLKLA